MLDELHNRVDEFCELLDETPRLPIIFTALRYELIYWLCLIKEQVRALGDLIESYSVTCMSSSSSSQRKQIYEALQGLFQHISHISKQVKFQSEAARFQKQELNSIFEGERT